MKTSSLLAAISLIAVLATSAVASEQVPFRGSLAAVQSGEVIGGFLIVEGSGTGRATELGRFTVTFHEEVDLSTRIGAGTSTFVAANTDSLFSSFIGHATPTDQPSVLPLASEQVPFRGSLAAVETDVVQGGTLIVDGSGVGNATELGRFAMTFHVEVDLGTLIGVGTATFVAANTDSLFTSFTGHATP